MRGGIVLHDVTVVRGGRALVRGVSFAVEPGAIGAILGPSGAGKSTILRAVAGLLDPDSGRIEVGGSTVFEPGRSMPPEQRSAGMLFQGFALWPHMTARQHLTFALKGRRVARAEWDARVRESVEALGIGNLLDRRPGTLSGGERQRLALARALVTRPAALLLDEPTASVDPAAARDVHAYVQDLTARFGTTTLLVTHDQAEALSLARTLLVIDRGEALQSGTPAGLYARPASRRVAAFLGEGVFLPATARAKRAETPLGPVALADSAGEGPGCVLLRPEAVRVAPDGTGVAGVVVRQEFRGPRIRLIVRVGEHDVLVDVREPMAQGTAVRIVHEGEAPFFPGTAP